MLLVARGIGERLGQNTPMYVANKIRADLSWVHGLPIVEVKELDWPAEYGPFPKPHSQTSFNKSLKDLHTRLNGEVFDDGSTMYVLVGYSGGAAGMGDWLAKADPKQKALVLGAVLIADPSMPRDLCPPDPIIGEPRFGIRGDRHVDHVGVKWIFNPEDVIPCCPENSPIRLIATSSPDFALADAMSWQTLPNKLAVRQASLIMRAQIANVLNKKNAQEQIEAIRRQFDVAFRDAWGYLGGMEHTCYTVRGPYSSHPTWAATAANHVTDLILNTYRA
ncbi:lysin B [Gordonia phage LuckyLeo]|nr:lysin B [Gordonia phage LuckyLeo]